MDKLKSYLLIIISSLLIPAMVGCDKDDAFEDFYGDVAIKSFYPLAVMEGSELTIVGTSLNKVTEIIFPENIVVKEFDIITPNSIKVKVPAGVSSGHLRIVADGATIESHLMMRKAVPAINSMVPGDEARELQEITIKGEDLECISKIIFPSAVEGEEIVVEAMSFSRKGTSHVSFKVPVGIMDGDAVIKLVALDGTVLNTNPIKLIAAAEEPDGSVIANIIHIGSGRYLTRNMAEEYPRVMDFTGAKTQEFTFVPVDGEQRTYYIKNNATNEFLVIGDENNWRMIWVVDPTTISNPDKGKYQIVELGENVQIKNVGSGHLGTDSNDENSEVYGDKYGETEPRFLWRLDIIKGSFDDVPQGSGSLWEGEFEFGDWNVLEISAASLSALKAGDTIRMYFFPETDQWPQMDLRDCNDASFPGFEWLGLLDFAQTGYVDFIVDQGIVDRLQSGGLLIRGSHYTITKVEIVPGASSGDFSPIVWEGTLEYGDWNVLSLGAALWSGLKDGDTIRMYFFPEADQWPQMDLRDCNDASFPGFEWLGLLDFAEIGYVDFVVDQGKVDRLQSGGLLIRGSHYTITKVEIISGSGAFSPLVWEGTLDYGDWNVLTLGADLWSGLKAGDTIRMHFYPEADQWPQMDLRDRNDASFPGFEWLGLVDFVENGYVDFVVDQGIVDRLQSGGLLIRGSHYTLTKVEII